jgi:hypothetical protein
MAVLVVQYTFTYKQYIEQHISLIRKSADRAPSLRGILKKKHEETLVRVVEECQLARRKQNIQNRAYIPIRIPKHNNKIKCMKNMILLYYELQKENTSVMLLTLRTYVSNISRVALVLC